MNFKKFIGVVSAIAIASSMAVVASANYSQDAKTGTQTWDFADYTAENATYTDVFAVGGAATISTSGISFGDTKSGTPVADTYATFTAPAAGTVVFTFKCNNSSGNYVRGYVYSYDEATDTYKQKAYTSAGINGGSTADAPAVTVAAGDVLYVQARSNEANKNRKGSLVAATFTPSEWVYDGVTVTPVAVTDEYTTADNKGGLAGVYTATIENDTEYTLNKVSVSAKANTNQTRGAEATVAEVAPGSSISIVVLVNGKDPSRITSISASLK